MARMRLFILGLAFLLALVANVSAKKGHDRIYLYEWSTDRCDGPPLAANVDLKKGWCVRLNSNSLTLAVDHNHVGWMKNNLQCGVTLYKDMACEDPQDTSSISDNLMVPDMMGVCYTAKREDYPIQYAKFRCESPETWRDLR